MLVESQSVGILLASTESETTSEVVTVSNETATGSNEAEAGTSTKSVLVPKLEAEMATSSRVENAVKRVETPTDFGWLWVTVAVVFGGALLYWFWKRFEQWFVIDEQSVVQPTATMRGRHAPDDQDDVDVNGGIERAAFIDAERRRSESKKVAQVKEKAEALQAENEILTQERDRLRAEIQKTTQTTEHIQTSLQKRVAEVETQMALEEQESERLRIRVRELENSGPVGRRASDFEALQKELRAVKKANRSLQTKLDAVRDPIHPGDSEKKASNGSASSRRRGNGSGRSRGIVVNSVTKSETALAETLARVRHDLSERKMELTRLGKQRDALIIERDALSEALNTQRLDMGHRPSLDSRHLSQYRNVEETRVTGASSETDLVGKFSSKVRKSVGDFSDGNRQASSTDSGSTKAEQPVSAEAQSQLDLCETKSRTAAPLTAFVGSTRRRVDEAKLVRMEEDLQKASQQNQALSESLDETEKSRAELEQSHAQLMAEMAELRSRLQVATSPAESP